MRIAVLFLAACTTANANVPLAENSRPGHPSSAPLAYQGIGQANSFTTSGLRPCVCDEGRRSRSTGKERDSETGLDYFGARYFSGAQGRFTSPDAPFADQDNAHPQSWNLYSYGRNNPLRFIDPDGRGCAVSGNSYTDNSDAGPDCKTVLSGDGSSQKVTVKDYYPPSPLLLAVALGAQRAKPVVDGAVIATGVIVTGGAAGIGAGAVGGASLLSLGIAGTRIAAPFSTAAVTVIFRAQQLTHAMRVEPGHTTPLGTIEEIKAAVSAAVSAGSYTVKSGGVVNGVAYINGVSHEFTGFMRTTGEVVFSNIYRK